MGNTGRCPPGPKIRLETSKWVLCILHACHLEQPPACDLFKKHTLYLQLWKPYLRKTSANVQWFLMRFSRIWEEWSILKEVGKGKHKVNNSFTQDWGPVIGNYAVSFLALMPEGQMGRVGMGSLEWGVPLWCWFNKNKLIKYNLKCVLSILEKLCYVLLDDSLSHSNIRMAF